MQIIKIMLIYRIVVCIIMFALMILFVYNTLINMNTEEERNFAKFCVLGIMLSAMAVGICLSAIILS